MNITKDKIERSKGALLEIAESKNTLPLDVFAMLLAHAGDTVASDIFTNLHQFAVTGKRIFLEQALFMFVDQLEASIPSLLIDATDREDNLFKDDMIGEEEYLNIAVYNILKYRNCKERDHSLEITIVKCLVALIHEINKEAVIDSKDESVSETSDPDIQLSRRDSSWDNVDYTGVVLPTE